MTRKPLDDIEHLVAGDAEAPGEPTSGADDADLDDASPEPEGAARARLAAELSEALDQADAEYGAVQSDDPARDAALIDGTLSDDEREAQLEAAAESAERRLDMDSSAVLARDLAEEVVAPADLVEAAALSLGKSPAEPEATPTEAHRAALEEPESPSEPVGPVAPATSSTPVPDSAPAPCPAPRPAAAAPLPRPASIATADMPPGLPWWRQRYAVGAALAGLAFILIAPALFFLLNSRGGETSLQAPLSETRDVAPLASPPAVAPAPLAPPVERTERAPGTRMESIRAGESERWMGVHRKRLAGRTAATGDDACRAALARKAEGRTRGYAAVREVADACPEGRASEADTQPGAGALPDAQPTVPDPLR